MLGETSNYRCIIQPRGGGAMLGELDIKYVESISWDRRLDEFSSAQVNFNHGCNCDALQQADPLATELLLFRDGKPVWVGPITLWEMGRSGGFVQAQDLSAWLRWRVVHTDIKSKSPDVKNLGEIARLIIDDALEPDNPNISVVVYDSGNFGEREALATDYLNSYQELEELLRTDLDMTMVGRVLYVYQTESPQTVLPSISDFDILGDVRVRRDGLGVATRVIVNGNENLWGEYPPSGEAGSRRYGLKERVFNETTILDQGSLDLAARTRYDLLKYPVVSVIIPEGSRLSPTVPVDINELIPGFRQKVTVTSICSPVSATFRLHAVDVDVSSESENVKVTYKPLGTTL